MYEITITNTFQSSTEEELRRIRNFFQDVAYLMPGANSETVASNIVETGVCKICGHKLRYDSTNGWVPYYDEDPEYCPDLHWTDGSPVRHQGIAAS